MELNKNHPPLMQLLSRRLRLFFVSSKNKGLPAGRQGFTIIELVVTISILGVVTTLIFANYPKFRENISLKKTAQEIALAIRQAQAYGLGVREYKQGSGIFPGYGVHFDIAFPDSFVLFADLDGDSVYDGALENVESFKIQTNERLSSLCANEKTPPSAGCGFNKIDIIFFRPKPLVTIKADGSNLSDAEIKISSPRGQIKTVVILSSGQISVE